MIKLGRAFGVILLLATQRPDKDSLPTGVSANVGTRFCLRVTGQVENDMVLGTSSYKLGFLVARDPEDEHRRILWPDSEDLTRAAIDDVLGAAADSVRTVERPHADPHLGMGAPADSPASAG